MRSDAQPPRSGGGSRTRNFRSISTLSIYPDPASSQQAFDASARAAERYLAASARSLGLAPWFPHGTRARRCTRAAFGVCPTRTSSPTRSAPVRRQAIERAAERWSYDVRQLIATLELAIADIARPGEEATAVDGTRHPPSAGSAVVIDSAPRVANQRKRA